MLCSGGGSGYLFVFYILADGLCTYQVTLPFLDELVIKARTNYTILHVSMCNGCDMLSETFLMFSALSTYLLFARESIEDIRVVSLYIECHFACRIYT